MAGERNNNPLRLFYVKLYKKPPAILASSALSLRLKTDKKGLEYIGYFMLVNRFLC